MLIIHNYCSLQICATLGYGDVLIILFILTFFIIIMVQVFNYKSYAGTSTVKYFTSGDFLKFPVKAEPPSQLPSHQLQQQQQQ